MSRKKGPRDWRGPFVMPWEAGRFRLCRAGTGRFRLRLV